MSWFTSLFTPKGGASTRKAMTSTHEAFSLPTTSPGFHPHPDAFNPETLTTPTTGDSAYSYPPPSSAGSYDYVPAAMRSRQSSILPLHSSSLPPLPSYPPLSHTWERLQRWLSREYPELGDTLNYGILPQDLAQIEMSMGITLPPAVRESYLCVDGQEAESAAGCSEGLFFGLTLLPLEDVLEEWRFWREVDDDPNTGANLRLREVMQSIPPGWVRREYSCRGWIPLVADKAGNYLGVDMNPAENGTIGQVIVFGRDFDTKVVMWRGDGPGGWGKWFSSFVDDIESGEGYELGSTNDGSDGSEDSVGYNSYFFDGVGGGQGDTGGDAGTGGLRLTGEYKGWSVLEAWADRSVRRWQEAGLYTDTVYPPWEKGKAPEKLSLDKIPNATSASEVPIPVLSEVGEETSALGPITAPAPPSEPLGNATNKAHTAGRPSLPTISITKPPAPLPVDLPTPEPLSSPTEFRAPPDGDLEAGEGDVMREIDINQPKVSAIPLSKPPALREKSPVLEEKVRVPSPPSRALTESPEAIIEEEETAVVPAMPDLLSSAESIPQPALADPPNPPESAPVAEAAPKAEDDSPVMVQAEESGDSGSSGAGDDSMQSDVVIIDEPEPAELARVRSNESTASGKSDKRKSISSSLKSFGQRGGSKRKSDSISSLKGSA
ncbi:hypothetical protein WOLCODRAFT_161341 [Wolfiporia cocos MD-104 SS10]|uniref:Knr4/Smi1-like domain-containing protein n=1 Tax=Wolfiporia cocos (strain MD-104) TaxID=742152 RepID=A0A2H3J955_WOLCO|nr:hypothetical protein WOLCODRAFT_161341 [Wolfiporia cocos MD-104 SS10]